MKDVRQSDFDNQIVIDVPNVVARKISEMCRDHAEAADTVAQEQRYAGLSNLIDRELEAGRMEEVQ